MTEHKGRAALPKGKQNGPKKQNRNSDYIADLGFCIPESRVDLLLGQVIAFCVSAGLMAIALAVLK